ncbi:MAG: PLP-dependent aminotransferase family protein, partial [Thermoanaerobaculia bacterium]|nr:PLP-dependent aminotransferase family protein [Thermoanaerobaculia bacterium]
PALDRFPFRLWSRLLTRAVKELPTAAWGYADAAGYPPLRRAVAEYLGESRGVVCAPEQVVIVSGSQQGIDLTARVLLDPGEAAIVEDPGYAGARAALWGAGIDTVPVPVDPDGLQVDRIAAAGGDRSATPRLCCVTPSHQYPLGATLSVARRLELLAWAREHDAWVLEDDYDSEFRYTGRPVATLKSLDGDGRVIYLGTFSKVMFPGLRLGYLVVPPKLVAAFEAARYCADRHSPVLDQAATTAFLEEGHFARHLRRMRVLYGERQQVLLEILDRRLGDRVRVAPAAAGMHLVAFLDPGVDDRAVAARVAAAGFHAAALSSYALAARTPPGLLLGYSGFDAAAMEAGVEILDTALAAVPPRTQ